MSEIFTPSQRSWVCGTAQLTATCGLFTLRTVRSGAKTRPVWTSSLFTMSSITTDRCERVITVSEVMSVVSLLTRSDARIGNGQRHVFSVVWSPVYTTQPVVLLLLLSNWLSNRFDNRLYRVYKNSTGCQTRLITSLTTGCIVYTASCQTGCQTGCTTVLTTGWTFVYTIQPVVKPAVQPDRQQVVSCKRGMTVLILGIGSLNVISILTGWFDSWSCDQLLSTNFNDPNDGSLSDSRWMFNRN